MTQTRNSWFARLCGGLRRAWRSGKSGEGDGNAGHGLNDRGLLVFAHTGEVIRAERALREAGFTVEVKGPPPRLRTGCDMVVVFPLLSQAAVLKRLKLADIEPEQVVSAHDVLLEPVSLFQTKRLGRWLMVRAANMKITIDTADERIVNISGGGCPDVPWLAQNLCCLRLSEAPEPLRLGQTLCCYSLQKAFEELWRQRACG
ncbi:hypothetical protein HMPREF0326_01761 [Desulfovibrio sp. 3_1_syn3]|uniref:DUF3343 domain-containing protein n=1 Tax=Desulfovibrio sp. 3_1_syn3 TaxID=457398 RepID=UPI0001E125CE|nr:DUF3343 domain-containing protein [Desulfovibrio sp. 3_1_syn3]EFL86058.1 hypothetical protein HMPREF0326_01761 [Desulfovibrio sp. 3_1_syn3]